LRSVTLKPDAAAACSIASAALLDSREVMGISTSIR
jgi:hypothetical protein